MNIDYSRYRMTYDLHTHTTYSHGWVKAHGKGTMEENVIAAIEAGLDGVAISDHGPGHIFYGIRKRDLPEMRQEIDRLRQVYPQINIYLSVEANVMEGPNHLDVPTKEFKKYDFVIAGYHYGVFNGHCLGNFMNDKHISTGAMRGRLLDMNTEMAVGAVYENDIKILTHPGDKGPFDIHEIAKACARKNTLMEISTWHSHLTVEEIKTAMKEDVSFIISSDAHSPERVGSFEGGLARAIEAGLDLDRIVNIEVIR